ncbi:hypothetical protein Tco_1101887 [Tanacetum coccineum]
MSSFYQPCYGCGEPFVGSFCPRCNPNSFDNSQYSSDHPPQLQFETYLCELCGNNAHYGYDCPPQFPLVFLGFIARRRDFLRLRKHGRRAEYNLNVLQRIASLKLINVFRIKREFKKRRKSAEISKSYIPYWNSSMIDDEEAKRTNFLKGRVHLLKECLVVILLLKSFSEYINCPSWNRPLFYFDDDEDDYIPLGDIIARYSTSKAITPIEEPDNSRSMGDEHLDTISSVEILVPIPRRMIIWTSVSRSWNDVTNNLCKLTYLVRYVLKSPSLFPISVVDSDSFFEESDTSLSYLDNSLPEFETFSDHTEKTRSGSTITHANYSLPEYDSFLFFDEPHSGGVDYH